MSATPQPISNAKKKAILAVKSINEVCRSLAKGFHAGECQIPMFLLSKQGTEIVTEMLMKFPRPLNIGMHSHLEEIVDKELYIMIKHHKGESYDLVRRELERQLFEFYRRGIVPSFVHADFECTPGVLPRDDPTANPPYPPFGIADIKDDVETCEKCRNTEKSAGWEKKAEILALVDKMSELFKFSTMKDFASTKAAFANVKASGLLSRKCLKQLQTMLFKRPHTSKVAYIMVTHFKCEPYRVIIDEIEQYVDGIFKSEMYPERIGAYIDRDHNNDTGAFAQVATMGKPALSF